MNTTKPKPIHPWSKGSVSPISYGPGKRDADHEAYDMPIPIRELAAIHGVRWYRDACGDDYIPGKYGEIFRYRVGKLGVQIGGLRANNTNTEISVGSNKYINKVVERHHWTVSQGGDGEIIFIVAEIEIKNALKEISAYKMPKGPDLKIRTMGLTAMEKFQFKTAEKGRPALQDRLKAPEPMSDMACEAVEEN
jgi:hypothetical protein